jgi:hypothetical protein
VEAVATFEPLARVAADGRRVDPLEADGARVIGRGAEGPLVGAPSGLSSAAAAAVKPLLVFRLSLLVFRSGECPAGVPVPPLVFRRSTDPHHSSGRAGAAFVIRSLARGPAGAPVGPTALAVFRFGKSALACTERAVRCLSDRVA